MREVMQVKKIMRAHRERQRTNRCLNRFAKKEFSMNPIRNFLHEEEGAVAIEYALLAALIALAIAAGATVLGKDICGVYTGIATALMTNPITVPTSFTACS